MQKETERQIFHLVLGTMLASMVLWLGKSYSVLLFGGLIVFGIIISELLYRNVRIQPFHWFIQRLERDNVKPGKGTLNFLIGSFVSLILFRPDIVFVSILILAFADSFSTIIGKGFGRMRVYNNKTVEGFFGGFFASFLVTLLYLNPYIGLVTCLAASLTELLSPIDDNLVIPPLSSLIIYMLTL